MPQDHSQQVAMQESLKGISMDKQLDPGAAVDNIPIDAEENAEGGSFYGKCVWLKGKVEIIWKRRKAFVRRSLVAIVLAVGAAFLIPNRYEATISLMPPDSSSLSMLSILMGSTGDDSSSGGSAASSAAGAIGDLLGLKDAGQLYVRAAQSHTVTDRIIRRFDLMNVYGDRYIEDCRKRVLHHVDIEEDKKSSVIDITVKDKDPKRAAGIANAYHEELNKLLHEVNTASARQEREVTASRVEDARVELEQASQRLAEFSSNNATLEPDDQGKAAIEISAAIEGQLIAAQSDLRSMEQLYTGNNQRIYSARARVNELQNQLTKANSAGVKGEATEGDMPSVRKLPIIGVEYLDLYRMVKVREAVFKVLTQEYELARIREEYQVNTVSIMDAPVVPTVASFPSLPMRIFLLIFLFLILIVGWTMFENWWEKSDDKNGWKLLLSPLVHRIVRIRNWLPFPCLRR